MRFETPPDRQLQAIFVHFVVRIGGERVHLAVLTLGYLHRLLVRAFRSEKQKHWLEALEEGFRHCSDVPQEVLMDRDGRLTGSNRGGSGWKSFATAGTIDWYQLQQDCRPIRKSFEATLHRVVELGYQRGEQTPWAKTVRTCQLLLKMAYGLWTFLEIEGVEPTNNAAIDAVFSAGVRALHQSAIQRKIRD